ncbi:MAG TPA: NAD(P)-dependent oxidoreductase [Alphaproteobacteria bacterium]|nr:NAD(P)-dependent oxidoreductase [Alphaproteobacteria bacterium]
MIAEIKDVGVVGLGKMGRPIARHLAAKGFGVTGFDVDPAAREAVAGDGVNPAQNLKDLARGADLSIIVVGFEAEVEAVLGGAEGLIANAKDGAIIAIASTVAPGFMAGLPDLAEGRDLALLDIPLCRGEKPAQEGKLLIMGGGDKAAFDLCRPAFSCFADAIFHLGPLGAGQVGKLVNNMILWTCISGNMEGLKLGEALGVSKGPLREALLASSAGNWALEVEAYNNPMPWAEKDMSIVLSEADGAGLSLPLSGVVKEVIKGIKLERGQPIPKPRK